MVTQVDRDSLFKNAEIHVVTIIAANYIARACVLSESIRKYHPEFKIHWFIADKLHERNILDSLNQLFDYIYFLEDLDEIPLKSWLFKYSVLEICTGVKPYIIKKILNDFPKSFGVLYLDPDIVLFSRLDDLLEYFMDYSILLTPHQTEPEQNHELVHDAIIDNEIASLNYGLYNLGFIGVRNDNNTLKFLDWWCDRLDRFCWASLEHGLWVDQKWINFVPIFFENVKIIKDKRFNVAPWNLTTRKLEGSLEEGLKVDGKPLGFYHFTGFDSGAHEIMAKKYSNNQLVENLIQWYKDRLKKYRHDYFKKVKWYYENLDKFENGERITKAHRLIYRIRRDLQEIYPDPYAVNEKSYYRWFQERAELEHPDIIAREFKKMVINKLLIKHEFSKIAKNPLYALEIFKKVFNILKNENIKGLMNRLIKR